MPLLGAPLSLLASERRHRVTGHVHGKPVAVRPQGISRERHSGQGLAGAEHPHVASVNQGPALQGSGGAYRPVDIAARSAGALAVLGLMSRSPKRCGYCVLDWR